MRENEGKEDLCVGAGLYDALWLSRCLRCRSHTAGDGRNGFTSNWPAEHLTFEAGTFRHRPYYKTESATNWTLDTQNQSTSADRLTQGGLGVLFDLKDPTNSSQRYLYKGTFFYSLNKVYPDSDNINVTVNSIYAHKWQSVNMEITFTIEGPAVTFSPGSFYQPEAVSVSFQF